MFCLFTHALKTKPVLKQENLDLFWLIKNKHEWNWF